MLLLFYLLFLIYLIICLFIFNICIYFVYLIVVLYNEFKRRPRNSLNYEKKTRIRKSSNRNKTRGNPKN